MTTKLRPQLCASPAGVGRRSGRCLWLMEQVQWQGACNAPELFTRHAGTSDGGCAVPCLAVCCRQARC
jgi:hypothetical protein